MDAHLCGDITSRWVIRSNWMNCYMTSISRGLGPPLTCRLPGKVGVEGQLHQASFCSEAFAAHSVRSPVVPKASGRCPVTVSLNLAVPLGICLM